jgi:hypothetical protein
LLCSNGSTLVLAVAYVADRNKNFYGIPLIPDELVDGNESTVLHAKDWIEN